MRTLRAVALLLVAATVAAGLFVAVGAYNVSATDQHTRGVYWLLKFAMRQSVHRRARDIRVPDLTDVAQVGRGRALYQAHCVRCHGAPGVAPDAFALGLTPTPANLAYTAREWPPQDLYWTIKSGLKMTAMPAWEFRLPEEDLWALVAYLQRMPYESPREYELNARDAQRASEATLRPVPQAPGKVDPERGKKALQQYGCATCHFIPGVTGATGPVGPPLREIARRVFIAGKLTNTPENMVRWLRAPQDVHPGSAMPNLGVTLRDARDIAAYLATLR